MMDHLVRAVSTMFDKKDADTLQAIFDSMNGKDWSSDTLDEIADILINAGYVIEEPEYQAP